MHVLEATPLVEGAGAVGSPVVKLTRPEVFVEVLNYRRNLLNVDISSVDKVYKVEFIFRLAP